ncbi:SDR family oxidoreductase [Streptomyces sp. ACA25]|uniref:SDR family oxidoreductase n=1 Tax=Streptomyces sp. ACA25 TaxID=3022596 RepID=UPI0023076DE2|nr:SDR family oxidoreductase [Streptomyces sp. ACA25]MDB1088829.1 SDR family oxidoreductase [Streptomyces sp. ACA25]
MDDPTLVTGGTGTLGRAVVRRLMQDERPVRVLSRRPRPVGSRAACEWAVGDLRTGQGIDDAVRGAGPIVHCATTRTGKDVTATRTLVEAAGRAGSPHLVYISIVGTERVPMFYYRAKHECERVVAESGLPWTILRATQFHDLLAGLTTAQRLLPVALAPGGGMCFQPVDVREVAERLVELASGAPAGRVPDLAGPEVREGTDLARAVLSAHGRRRPVVPVVLPGKASRALRDGALTVPERAVGRITFEEYLAR